jgi:D-alanyl-D-alanine carboxypeptidase (penicillin-binding protein 5/6)
MDSSTGKVLISQNSDERRQIASMVKMMTLILVFEEFDRGSISADQDVVASANAAGMGGSQAFLDSGSTYKAGELIKSVVVASANDACVALAEHIGGSVERFVDKMNEKAAELGLRNTNFINCTGLPADGQYSSAFDAAVMLNELINHKEFFDYSRVWMFDFVHPSGRVTELTNTNKLVRFYEGCDGGKTGYTEGALSCLAATAKRGDTRLISVILASPTAKERNAEVGKMFDYGFANFETKKPVSGGVKLEGVLAEVKGGKFETAEVAPEKDYLYLVKKGERPEFSYKTELNKLKAPVAKGACAGKLIIMLGGEAVGEVNLITTSAISKVSYLDIINRMIEKW